MCKIATFNFSTLQLLIWTALYINRSLHQWILLLRRLFPLRGPDFWVKRLVSHLVISDINFHEFAIPFYVFFRLHPYTVVLQHAAELSVRVLLSQSWLEEWKENVFLKWIKMLHLIQLTYLSSLADTEQYNQALLANKSNIYTLVPDGNTIHVLMMSTQKQWKMSLEIVVNIIGATLSHTGVGTKPWTMYFYSVYNIFTTHKKGN